jgi:hypothetical protein
MQQKCCNAAEDSDHEFAWSQTSHHGMVLPDSEVEDDAGGGAKSPGSSNNNKSD